MGFEPEKRNKYPLTQETMSEYLDKLPQLDKTNAEILKGYIRKQDLKQLQPASIQDKVWRV
ncbi:MAG: hypothetical protein WCJ49_05235 [Deltaproteobacteria bacterium]